eukprot:1159724-Pelagomonas_calceolata.AAC.10
MGTDGDRPWVPPSRLWQARSESSHAPLQLYLIVSALVLAGVGTDGGGPWGRGCHHADYGKPALKAWAQMEMDLGRLAAAKQILEAALQVDPGHMPSYKGPLILLDQSCACPQTRWLRRAVLALEQGGYAGALQGPWSLLDQSCACPQTRWLSWSFARALVTARPKLLTPQRS